jgi:hypothetical protein
VLYGYDHVVAAAPLLPNTENQLVQDMLAERRLQMEVVKQHLTTVQNRIKVQADKHRSDREFKVGAKVLLKLQPYAQSSVVSRPFHKLAYKYYGPFSVLDRIGKATYKLDLPPGSLIHLVFHIL